MILIAGSFAAGFFTVFDWPVMLHTLGGSWNEYGSARSSAVASFLGFAGWEAGDFFRSA